MLAEVCRDEHRIESEGMPAIAMGIPTAEAVGSVRLTLERATTDEDVGRAADTLTRA
jgi:cysteine sulfinate desulfinase/cysteine desulfurase-like protein